MSEEQPKSSSGGGSKRRRRRRPSRKRQGSNQSRNSEAQGAPSGKSASAQGSSNKNRRRRRRRSRSRKSSGGNNRGANTTQVLMLDARLSESIFVYTHVLRSSELDTYGFRPDPFLNSSRDLRDFRIDMSAIFPDDAAFEAASEGGEPPPIFDSALHGPIVTHVPEDAPNPEATDSAGMEIAGVEDVVAASDWLDDVKKAVDDHKDATSPDQQQEGEDE